MKSWQESPAELIVQPPSRSVRPSVPGATVAGGVAVPVGVADAVCSPASTGDVTAPATGGAIGSTCPGGGNVPPVTEPDGTAAIGSGALARGSSRPKDNMLQPAARNADTPTVMRV